MVNDKMCVGVLKDDLMCRINPENQEEALKKTGCREMDFTKRPMKGYVMVDESGMRSDHDFDYWISLSLEYNSKARASKEKKKK